MEFEPEGTLEAMDELREARIARPRKEMGELDAREWSRVWSEAWSWANTAAMEVEVEVRRSARPWAEVWTRAEAQAWAAASAARVVKRCWWVARVDLRTEWANKVVCASWEEIREEVERAEAEALLLAGALGEARARAPGAFGYVALEDLSTIRDILSDLNHSGVARNLWVHSPKTRGEYSYLTYFITPINRLPVELLHEIFLAIIEETSRSPLVLMHVCKHWHAIVTGIWASLNLGTTTSISAVKRKLEMNQWLLDIIVDTDPDRGTFTIFDGAFEAIFAAIEASSRWRSLVIKSFPAEADLPEDLVNSYLWRCPRTTMSRFTTFKVKSACETSPLLDGLLHIIGTTASSELTMVEINSANVISFLASLYPSIFHSVTVLSLDAPGIRDPVDLLPHLHQLETLTASHLSFLTYPNHIELPIVHTLRHLSLRAAPIQWMSGRTFHILENCTLTFPRYQHVLNTFNTTLPNCNRLIFQGYPLEVLGGVSAHNLGHLSVTCNGSFNRRGNQQLVWLSRQVFGGSRLAPKILHISIQATNQAWVNALGFMSNLEELSIHNAHPSSLGATVFHSFVVQPVHAGNVGAPSTPEEISPPICPSLRRFRLNYDRWLRPSEEFDLVPVFVSIIQSRRQSRCPLQSFNLCIMGDQEAPIELTEESDISDKGFNRLRGMVKGHF